MTDTAPPPPASVQAPLPEPLPEPLPASEPAPAAVAPPRRRRRALGFVAALLFLSLGAAVGWLWEGQQELAARLDAPRNDAAAAQVAALQRRLDTLDRQLAALQQRPAPASPDLRPLEARIAALEQQPPQQPPPAAPDIGPLSQKLDSVAADAAAAQTAMAGRLAALGQRLDTAVQQATALAGRAAAAQALARAQVALDAGQPLGDIAAAPPALSRFAHEKPPTEASLRLAFPAAAAAAERASQPATQDKSLGERMWLRMRSLVTVKQGDRVLVGAPAAEVLGQAQARLDAGDLAGTLTALDALDGAAAQAMGPWRTQAQSLLDARTALAAMAHDMTPNGAHS